MVLSDVPSYPVLANSCSAACKISSRVDNGTLDADEPVERVAELAVRVAEPAVRERFEDRGCFGVADAAVVARGGVTADTVPVSAATTRRDQS
jgi:hypothetical protein